MSVERALAALGTVRRRAPFAYASSWPLEEVELERADGSPLRVLVKRLDAAPASKPTFLCDPAREAEAYRLLARERLGTPHCHGGGPGWVVLELVEGTPLWQRADVEAWAATARWAAALHARFAARPPAAPALLRRDAALHRRLLARAPVARELLAAGEAAVARLAALPPTLIHGELYPANVLVGEGRVAPVDWEMAAIAPGVLDLAALATGWAGEQRAAILAAYGAVAPADLAAAELLLALQWLGWAEGWQAPPEQRRDWLAEARAAAERLR
jgi:Phosphotransferase enzyme family